MPLHKNKLTELFLALVYTNAPLYLAGEKGFS